MSRRRCGRALQQPLRNTLGVDKIISIRVLSAGFIAGVAGVLPALLFHLAFMTDYPAITNLEIPTYHLIENLQVPYLLEIFVCMLFVTIVQTGVGVNERRGRRVVRGDRSPPISTLQSPVLRYR